MSSRTSSDAPVGVSTSGMTPTPFPPAARDRAYGGAYRQPEREPARKTLIGHTMPGTCGGLADEGGSSRVLHPEGEGFRGRACADIEENEEGIEDIFLLSALVWVHISSLFEA